MFLNQAAAQVGRLRSRQDRGSAQHLCVAGTKVEIVFPDEYEGSQLYDTIGAQSVAQRPAPHDGDALDRAQDLLGAQNGYDA